MKTSSVILIALMLGSFGMNAQGSLDYGTGLKINFNDKGSKYMRFVLWNQIWARSIDNLRVFHVERFQTVFHRFHDHHPGSPSNLATECWVYRLDE